MDSLTAEQLAGLIKANTTGPFKGLITPEYLVADQSNRLIRCVIALAFLQVIFVALFFISRIKVGTANGLDTYLIVPAFLTSFSHLIVCWLFIKFAHLGQHVVTLTPSKQAIFLKLQLSLSMLNPPAITLPKLAILCLYIRVFTTRPSKWAAYGVASVLVVTWIVYICIQMVMCVPFNFNWNKSVANGRCLDQFPIFIWMGLPSIVTDIAIIILPLPLIWRLRTSTNQKIGLTITFLTGSVGIITAVIRFAVFLELRNPGLDLTWTGIDVVMWTTIEPGVYLIAACLPSLRPLFNPIFKEFDTRALRDRFRSNHQSRLPPNLTPRDIHLSEVTVETEEHKASRGPRSPRSGFRRLDETSWSGGSSRFNERNTHSGVSTYFRERDSVDSHDGGDSRTELQDGRQYKLQNSGIVVEKAFTISTEPANP